ncbi:uncharacterized protein NPIL_595401 [Nephila pilipes]|uniref:Uncharacterized protein n=1 Tax=Nephila pilipes TaxID=299642 RepID=A0A8X6N0U9_NEPPI|nr:uncharacterized protein NPIL_595401 [Nephila pilipes]
MLGKELFSNSMVLYGAGGIRHICPHRKKSQLNLGSDQQCVKSVKVTSREEKLKQRKQWETRTEQQNVSLSTDQLNAQALLASSEGFASSVTVTDTGNRNGTTQRAQGNNWSAKQIPKTLPIKRPDNLKSEGQAEFTTTHQHDFTKKSTELHIKESTRTSSEMVQAESWNNRQIPKTQIIKKEDTLMLTGPLESETTHKAAYNESAFKSNAQHSEQAESYKRPRTSLKLSGEFQSDSSYQEAFTPKQTSDTFKVKKGESKSNLKLEGEMSFERTSLDYNAASTQISRRSESAEDITALKAKKTRPESEIKIPDVPISNETTIANDFKRWNVERPVIHKPKDTLTIGDSDATDLNTTFILEKSSTSSETSKMETTVSDYKNWEVSRPVVHKPENNLKSEGSFNFETTTDAAFSSRRSMVNKNTDLQTLTERTETESIAQSVQEERTAISIAKSDGDKISSDNGHVAETTETKHRQESNGTISTLESNAFQVHKSNDVSVQESNSVSSKVESTTVIEQAVGKSAEMAVEKSAEMAIEKSVRDGSLVIEQKISEDQEIASQSEDQTQYVSWDQIRPKPIRQHSNLRQEGGMEFDTTNRSEFVSRSVERVKGIRPKTETKLFEGEFDAKTMNQVMFSTEPGEKVTPFRPKSNLHLEDGNFIDETTTAREFQPREVQRPAPIIPKSNLMQEGTMDFTTTNLTEFEGKMTEKVQPIRPTTTNKISGEIDLNTTNRVMHPEFPIERVKKIVPQSTLRMNSGVFESETTNKSQFQDWAIDRPKPIKPVPNLTQEGSMDFTTMNNLQFHEKPIEKVQQFRPQTTAKITGEFDGTTTNQVMFQDSPREKVHAFRPQDNLKLEGGNFTDESTTKKEFQNWEYVKPSPIKHDSTMKQEGDIDFSTTNRREYVRKTAGEVAMVKTQATKPKDNLRLEEGDFTSETTNKKEFQNWEYVKQSPIKHDSTMTQEGDFDFSTTNRREYIGKNAEEIAVLKSQAYRPKHNLKLEGGDFTSETTNKKEFQNWEYVKPSPIKHDSSMRQEGDIDFSTTTRREYVGKTAEEIALLKSQAYRPQDNLKLEGGDFATESTTKKEFQNWEYVKPSPIKHDSSMRQEGDIDFSTTTRREYVGKTAEEMALLKSQAFRPQDNLRLEGGDFATESTTKKEFQNWEYVKPSLIKHDSTMRQEGEIDFSTTSGREYVGKTAEKVTLIKPASSTKITGKFEGTTTNQAMYQDSPREKVKAFKPQDNLKLEGGDFATESTTKKEYQNWEYVKPSPIKHNSSMKQEGDIDFSTTTKREFVGKTAEKVSPVKPVSTTKISGDFDGTTTNQAMFQGNKSVEKVKGKRPQTNIQLEKGKFEDQTTARREFQQWEISKPQPIKPTGNLVQEGGMDFTTSNKTDFQPKSGPAAQPIRPKASSPVSGEFDGTTTNKAMFKAQTTERVHDIRPKDNLRVDSGQFVCETTNSKEFNFKAGSKPEPIKHKSNLTQEGEFDFTTTNQTQFEKKQINKVSQIRPKTLTKASDGKFYSTTTNQAMFQTPEMKTVHGIKPSDNLHVEKGKFNSNTTSSDEYQQWKVQKPTAYQLESSLKQEGNMHFETTNKTEFKERSFDKVKQIRPKTTNKIEGDFDATTTNQVMFQQHGSVQRVKPIRHESNLRLEGGKFANETTNTREYRQWVKMENKDSQNKRKIEAAGVRSVKEKSEVKKDSGAQNIKSTVDKDGQHEPWKLSKETGETIVKETKTINGQSQVRLVDEKTKTQNESERLKRSEETTQIVKSKVEFSKSDASVQKQEIDTRSSQTIQRTNGERQQRIREISAVVTDNGAKQSPKVKSIIPAGNLNNEGDMTFTTTSQTDFSRQTATMSKNESKQIISNVKEVSEKKSQKSVADVRTKVSTGNLFSEGDMTFLTTSKTDFSPQKVTNESKQMSAVHKETVSRQSKVAVENEMALNATLSRRSVSKESLSKGMSSRDSSMSPQKTPSKTKRYKPEDNLKIEAVPFDATSTTRTEFKKWETRRSSSKKRNESLKQEGSMEFNVTSNDYSLAAYQANRDQIKAKSKADQRGSLGQSGAMEFHTTSNSSYTVHTGSYGTKSKTTRPRTSLKLGSEDTAIKQDAMSSSRSNPEISTQELVSTSRAAYVTHTPSRRSVANRPTTNQKIGEGSFESQTTTRSSFTVHQGQHVEKSRPVRHESHNILNTENGFTGATTYRNSFETVKTHHCPILDLEAGRSALSFNEEKNGHLFYAPRVQG